MRFIKFTVFLSLALQLFFINQASAEFDSRLENTAPPIVKAHQNNIIGHMDDPSTANQRQGGDDVSSAYTILSIPFEDTGTTCGYEIDFPEYCPSQAFGPDVVYAFTAPADMDITVDLCLSSYDTMVFVFDEWLQLVACDDDYYFHENDPCGMYNSKIERASLAQGAIYYIVVGGYSYMGCGDYQISVTEYEPCILDCVGVLEGEPSLHDGYVDNFNGGCNSVPSVFQTLEGDASGEIHFCGKSGWYESPDGDPWRDTDWFITTIGPTGIVEWTVESEEGSNAFLLAPHDCENVAVVDQLNLHKCTPASLIIQGQPGDMIWLWFGPDSISPPGGFEGHEYDYMFTLTGLEGTVSVEQTSLSALKGLFR